MHIGLQSEMLCMLSGIRMREEVEIGMNILCKLTAICVLLRAKCTSMKSNLVYRVSALTNSRLGEVVSDLRYLLQTVGRHSKDAIHLQEMVLVHKLKLGKLLDHGSSTQMLNLSL